MMRYAVVALFAALAVVQVVQITSNDEAIQVTDSTAATNNITAATNNITEATINITEATNNITEATTTATTTCATTTTKRPPGHLNNSKLEQQAPVKKRKFCDKCVKPCGTVPPIERTNRVVRIVNGFDAKANEFGWAGVVQRELVTTCGATLITKKHVLTAGHCTEGLTEDDLQVVMGDYNRFKKPEDNPGKSVHKVVAVHQHPDYRKSSLYDHDISILELEHAVDLSNPWVRVACLPRTNETNYVGMNATVIGWGRLGLISEYSTVLKKIELPIISNEECKTMVHPLDTKFSSQITDNMICAGHKEGKMDACRGDSGGGMLRYVNNNKNVMEIIGIISWGKGCARSYYPGMYTKVSNYLDWIIEKTGDECICGTESF